jgi:hypothetical protein
MTDASSCKVEKYNNKYTEPYYYRENQLNNCCNGRFFYPKNSDGTHKKNKLNTLLLITRNARDSVNFGDISYPRNQNGRWNTSLTNTKMHPVNSVKAILDASNNTIGYKTASQSGNIFRNTHHNMSKKKMFSYYSKNKAHFRR